MPSSPESLAENLEKLIAKLEGDKAHYLSKEYSEAQARIDFITPFFEALGWDVENEAGLPHHEREVIVEKGETEGRPDYNFRVGGQTKLFVEAKALQPRSTTQGFGRGIPNPPPGLPVERQIQHARSRKASWSRRSRS